MFDIADSTDTTCSCDDETAAALATAVDAAWDKLEACAEVTCDVDSAELSIFLDSLEYDSVLDCLVKDSDFSSLDSWRSELTSLPFSLVVSMDFLTEDSSKNICLFTTTLITIKILLLCFQNYCMQKNYYYTGSQQ